MWINKGKKVPLMGFQTGGYIPGLSGVQFRGGLQKDIRQTQEDIEEQSGDLAKHQKKTGLWGQVGGWLGEKGLQYAMTAASAGNPALAAIMKSPLGKAAVKGIGKGAGQLFGSKGAGKAPEITDSSTGLLGGQYDILRDVKQRSEDAIGGKALKAGASRFLTAGGGEYIEDSLARKAGIGGEDFAQKVTDKGLEDNPWLTEPGDWTPEVEGILEPGVRSTGTSADVDFDLDLGWEAPVNEIIHTGKEGGYVPGYENGGEVGNNNFLSRLGKLSDMKKLYEGEGPRTKSGHLKFGPMGMDTREGIAEDYNFPLEEAVFDTIYGGPGSGNMAIDISVPSQDSKIKYQRSGYGGDQKGSEFLTKSSEAKQAMRKAFPDEYQSLATDIGFGDYAGAIEKVGSGWLEMSPLERMRSKTSAFKEPKIEKEPTISREEMMKSLNIEDESEYDAFIKWKKSRGLKHGGYVRNNTPLFNPMSSHGAIDSLMLMEKLK